MKDCFGALCLLVLLTSGGIFQPQMVDAPLIDKKAEYRVDLGVSSQSTSYATVTYAFTDKMALQVFGNIGPNGVYYTQGAVGLFKDLGRKMVLEWYSGFGYGYAHHDLEIVRDQNYGNGSYGNSYGNNYDDAYMYDLGSYISGNYQSYFTQLNFGLAGCEFEDMDVGISLNASCLTSNLSYIDTYKFASNYLMIEPLAFFRFGGERLKFSFKIGNSWMFKLANSDSSFPFTRVNVGLGMNYYFQK